MYKSNINMHSKSSHLIDYISNTALLLYSRIEDNGKLVGVYIGFPVEVRRMFQWLGSFFVKEVG